MPGESRIKAMKRSSRTVHLRFLAWLGSHELAVLLAIGGIAAGVWMFATIADEVLEGAGAPQAFDRKLLLAMRRPGDLAQQCRAVVEVSGVGFHPPCGQDEAEPANGVVDPSGIRVDRRRRGSVGINRGRRRRCRRRASRSCFSCHQATIARPFHGRRRCSL